MENIGIYPDKDIKAEIKNFEEIQNFLRKVMENFIEESLKFYSIYQFFPFTNGEKQVLSALFPAIYKITENVFLEQPFYKYDKSNPRFLDIITINDNKQIFFIELKHTYLEINKDTCDQVENPEFYEMNKFNDYLHDKWLGKKKENIQGENDALYGGSIAQKEDMRGAIEQIQDITKENMQDQFYFKLGDFDCKKIALLIIPSFIENNDSDIIGEVTANEYSEYIFKKFEKIIGKNDNAKPNCIITYKFKESNDYKHKFKEPNNKTRIETYPFLTFVARVEDMKINN